MIWFFLMGMIAGAAGVVMVLKWWLRTHMQRVTAEEMINDLREAGYPERDGDRDREGRTVPEPDRDADRAGDLGKAPLQRVEDEKQGES